ncbi:hypothetical protein O9G_006388 [Rozella allomycis CSF55]|uniref:Uncharacterized protein n=1 Tax=Rozella allomycis (strain CSF55) TaxID=988480 RepID=A0A075B2S1_ROZAC|nr:hypothetical protein O9G_006388 [Rozella allomycis CSF55]|eukprot:EPZ36624.1 hypothetical protein O9G_006388 [Rozella allomycis CSF55]
MIDRCLDRLRKSINGVHFSQEENFDVRNKNEETMMNMRNSQSEEGDDLLKRAEPENTCASDKENGLHKNLNATEERKEIDSYI